MRIATFNVQNLRLRRIAGRQRFDGARDRDAPGDDGAAAAALDLADRRLTARIIAEARADVVCLQEVFDRATLDYFHDHLLRHAGAPSYPHRVCEPGNDGGGRDLALLSRLPLADVQGHARLRARDMGRGNPPGVHRDTPVFRRDCLRARVGPLTLFLCHFKAPWPDPEAAWPVRRLEAEAVRWLIEAQFPDPARAWWLVLGDLNDPEGVAQPGSALEPLAEIGVDLMARMPKAERWTFHEGAGGRYGRPDALLASPALAAAWPEARPQALRAGLSRDAERYGGPRLADVGAHRPHASDHAPLLIAFDGMAGAKAPEP